MHSSEARIAEPARAAPFKWDKRLKWDERPRRLVSLVGPRRSSVQSPETCRTGRKGMSRFARAG